ncbi:hypothetical protein [Pseudochryseolinea flava]|uniref:Uncharacterized protein n=1 Tax=Pseudochryseolinea flava TaxID=2059302 RepID=A0A364Y8D7_9BACT|nr:hypothetical protein [Pseudochryseolinea flava]RAW03173.1 hypothetical protein DQQ10_03520 [Pseudochryseolinea flava]
MKINSENFKGIEYIQLNQLPDEQRSKILESLDRDYLIKILIDGKVISNCLQYTDYSFWYENIYKETSKNRLQKSESEAEVVNLAFQH